MRGALPPVDLRVVCLVRAMMSTAELKAKRIQRLCRWPDCEVSRSKSVCFLTDDNNAFSRHDDVCALPGRLIQILTEQPLSQDEDACIFVRAHLSNSQVSPCKSIICLLLVCPSVSIIYQASAVMAPKAEKKPAQPVKKAVAKKSSAGRKKGSKKAVESYKIYICKVCTSQLYLLFTCRLCLDVMAIRALHDSVHTPEHLWRMHRP